MHTKTEAIRELLKQLVPSERGWIVVDHWEADLCAIGIARATEPRRLVYVSTFNKLANHFDYECEVPPEDKDEVYRVVRTGQNVSYKELVQVITAHLA